MQIFWSTGYKQRAAEKELLLYKWVSDKAYLKKAIEMK